MTAVMQTQQRKPEQAKRLCFCSASGQSGHAHEYPVPCCTTKIIHQLLELYGVEVSPTLISNVTEAVMDEVRQWQARPLEAVYPIVYFDGLVVKVRENQRVINKALHLVLGVNLSGHKELLGMWLAQNEGAKFWLGVLTDLQNRGVKDVFIACVDGLTGFPEAI